MLEWLRQFGASLIVFTGIDLIWLGWLAKDFYKKQLGEMMSTQPIWPAAILFYVLFLIGLNYFAISPALESGSARDAWVNGALFGFFTYMTYELTNLAVLANWPKALVIPDILWGTLLASVVSGLTFKLLS